LSTNLGQSRKFRVINTLNQKLATNSGKTSKYFLTFAVQNSKFFIEVWVSLGFCFSTGYGGLMGDIGKNFISEERSEI